MIMDDLTDRKNFSFSDESKDLRTHFLILFIEELPQGVKKAHIAWMNDFAGPERRIDSFNLHQLQVSIICISADSSTHNGYFFFKGNDLETGYYPKD
jgi:hypothetical protein